MCSWNINIRVIYDVSIATHCYLVEGLTDGRHAKQLIYKKYLNFLHSIATNRRQALVSLFNCVKSTCQSVTGANIRKIVLDTGTPIEAGISKGYTLQNYRVYETPVGQEWRLPLLISLLEIQAHRWGIDFDEETQKLTEDEISSLINNICSG